MTPADIAILVGLVVTLAAAARMASGLAADDGRDRFARRHTSVTARAWEGVILVVANARRWSTAPATPGFGTNRRRLAISAAMVATTLTYPYLALRAGDAGGPLADDPMPAGIAALAYTLVLESVTLPDRLASLGILSGSATGAVVHLAFGSLVLDVVFVSLAFAAPGQPATDAALLGAGFVAAADLVSLGWTLFLAAPAEYPIAP
jgi:hypothetical protein